MADNKVRHILGLSGGKDSTALALYLKNKVPDVEYFFCDTHKELPETYVYIRKLEILLGKKIKILESERGFDHWLSVYGGFLPSAQARWCTRQLKLKPIEKFIGDDEVISYIAIRADENRVGYISTKPNIKPVFPFMKDGLIKQDILKIIENSGIGMPDYYSWRSRSGCYFCFFQRRIEWIRLSEVHPDLFEKAVQYEQNHADGRRYSWIEGESLLDLLKRKDQIISDHTKAMNRKRSFVPNQPLVDAVGSVLDEDEDNFCFVCNL